MCKLYWIAVIGLFYISACTKIETTNIGSGLIPPIDGVITLDTTLEVFTDNYIDPLRDSVKVYKADDHVIGVINNDLLFGKTTASAFFELKPTSYKYSFPEKTSIQVDSAMLILSYKGVYGDTTIPQRWEVREVAEPMQGDTVYSTGTSFSTSNTLNAQGAVVNITAFNDSFIDRHEKAANQIRIMLDKSFAERLILQYDSGVGHAYENDSLFREHFKGFAVMPAEGSPGNALVRINLADTNTKLALYYNYKKANETARDTTVSYFRFSSGGSSNSVSANANYIKRFHAGSELANFTSNPDNDSLAFMQTSPGTFVTIKIPDLKLLPNIIVHRAELLTFGASSLTPLDPVSTPPRFLLLSGYDTFTKPVFNIPNDFSASSNTVSNIETFGGYIMQKDVSGAGVVWAYTFDLSRYVQGIVTRKEPSFTLRLSAPSNDSLIYSPPYLTGAAFKTFYVIPTNANTVGIGRVVLGGGGMRKDNPMRMRLRIIYSKI